MNTLHCGIRRKESAVWWSYSTYLHTLSRALSSILAAYCAKSCQVGNYNMYLPGEFILICLLCITWRSGTKLRKSLLTSPSSFATWDNKARRFFPFLWNWKLSKHNNIIRYLFTISIWDFEHIFRRIGVYLFYANVFPTTLINSWHLVKTRSTFQLNIAIRKCSMFIFLIS